MRDLKEDLGAVASIVVLTLLALIAMTLGGAFNGLSEGQAAFLGTLSGALIGFVSLLGGALFNAQLNRQLVREDEAKRARSCLMMLHARTRALATSMGLLGRLVEATNQITADGVESFELAARSMRPEEFPDIRLIDEAILTRFHDLNSHMEGARFSHIGPVKLCKLTDGVYLADPEFIANFSASLGALCDDAIGLRKAISAYRKVPDLGAESFSAIQLPRLHSVNGTD